MLGLLFVEQHDATVAGGVNPVILHAVKSPRHSSKHHDAAGAAFMSSAPA